MPQRQPDPDPQPHKRPATRAALARQARSGRCWNHSWCLNAGVLWASYIGVCVFLDLTLTCWKAEVRSEIEAGTYFKDSLQRLTPNAYVMAFRIQDIWLQTKVAGALSLHQPTEMSCEALAAKIQRIWAVCGVGPGLDQVSPKLAPRASMDELARVSACTRITIFSAIQTPRARSDLNCARNCVKVPASSALRTSCIRFR